MSRALALVDSADEPLRPESADSAQDARPLLETKLYVPRTHSPLVARPRLTTLFAQRDAHRLTLVAAPTGFGKTTLLAGWLAEHSSSVRTAWLSLDASDNEPRVFWTYVVRALQKSGAVHGEESLELLRSSRAPEVDDTVVTRLINEVAEADIACVLVLDDYHVIEAPRIHAAMTFLIERLPPRMHVVIGSRSEPPLALARLRARGELLEVRIDEMRFTLDEASAFLNSVMALGLSPRDLGTLTQRTEGWIAGLKLAALSLEGRDDRAASVAAFSGSNRHVADYLIEEVLRTEPERVRRFLLATSILQRLSGPLCDAVLDGTGSQVLLEDLERRNLFTVALDDRREWFRYHHLFAEVLQKQALAADADALRAAHRRASAWFEAHEAPGAAVHHALAAEDTERAARLLECTWPEKDRSYESALWLTRVKALPQDVIRGRPVLAMGFAWALLNSGELEAAELRLRDVERALEADAGTFQISDEARFRSLPMELASARIYLTQSLGDLPGTLEHAARALERIPAEDTEARGTGLALVALALWGRGELERAHDTFSEALAAMRSSGHELDVIRGMFVLGDLRAAQGRLRDAAREYERGLALARESPRFANAETDELHLGLSEVHREWNDLTAATAHLDAIARARESVAHQGNRLRWCAAMASVRLAYGDSSNALSLLDEAETHERRDPVPRVRPIPAMKARVRIARGELDHPVRWAAAAGVSTNDELSYLLEYEHLTLVRLRIAQRASLTSDVVSFLDRLRTAAQTGGRMGSLIEILMLQALAQRAANNVRAALDALAESLALAEGEGYARVFLDAGEPMRELLRTATMRGLAGAYTRRILSAFEAPVQPSVAAATPATVKAAAPTESGEALTTRELEILRLIAAGLRNQAIADHLSISVATVKRHIANAYLKLGAGHRTEALARAAALRIL